MSFETFFLGKERVKNPFVGEMASAGAEISGKVEGGGSISMKYGSRMIITAERSSIPSLTEDDFVEVADYDAVRNIAMVIGVSEPSADTPLHWLIYRRDDINAIVSFGKIEGKSIDYAMGALKELKNSNSITLKGYGKIAVGKNLKEAVEGITCL